MEVQNFLIDGSVYKNYDKLNISVCGSTSLDHSDGDISFQSYCWQLVSPCWDILCLSCKCLTFKGFQRLVSLWFQSQWRFVFLVACIKILYSPFQNKSCGVGCVLVLRVPWFIYLWNCFSDLSYHLIDKFHLLTEELSYESEVVIHLI